MAELRSPIYDSISGEQSLARLRWWALIYDKCSHRSPVMATIGCVGTNSSRYGD